MDHTEFAESMETNPDATTERQFVIIGGGPAGLTAGLDLTKHQLRPIVFEKYNKVGGIARTENYKGYYFDMGGHRFFTKSAEVNQFWQEVMGDDFLVRPRLSRIYYNRKFFFYPLKPINALQKLGILQSILVGFSYLRWQVAPYKREDTFEQWVTNRFGKRLFNLFFKSYTEKVWGISTNELTAEWAAQRIKDLDLKTAVLSMFIKPKKTITTLIEQFHYPRQGPGMMWNKVKSLIEQRGGQVHLDTTVCGFNRVGNRIVSVETNHNGEQKTVYGTDFISSMPITEFINKLNPPPPPHVLEAASKLSYRDFLTVCLIVDKPQLFDDNWIYIHDPSVTVGRIQNFKNWSPDMVPDMSKTSLGMEYFCNMGDELWNAPDEELVELGKREIEKIGLAKYEDVLDGAVFRVEKSYPVYDSTYTEHLAVLREYVETLENFQTIGRNGLHRYNNQDHAMLTGMLAVRNALFGEDNNLWVVNAEQEYHEEIQEKEIQAKDVQGTLEEAFAHAFLKLEPKAFGISWGVIVGAVLFLLTLIVNNNGWIEVARKLVLLQHFFPGYAVTAAGSFSGLAYGFLGGFLVGWMFAFTRNAVVLLSMAMIHRKAEMRLLRKILDF